jgi:Ni,Fe-hydrogenase III component G
LRHNNWEDIEMATYTSPVEGDGRTGLNDLTAAVGERFGSVLSPMAAGHGYVLMLSLVQPSSLPSLCRFLFSDRGCQFGGMIAEEHSSHWQLHYAFLLPGSGWIDVLLSLPIETTTVPSIVAEVNAADWHEREVEDLFGIHFEGHPRLGDFILHDQIWREGIDPMRKNFAANRQLKQKLDLEWQPLLIVGDPGSFAMPVGPVYDGGLGESLHFLLETVGEDVFSTITGP